MNQSLSSPSEMLRDEDYHMASRQQKHRIHYSRIKSAAIAASYRLMHVSTDNVLVRMTANAAVNGMRPEYVKTAEEHKQSVEPDIVEDEMYNHKEDVDPIVDLCLIKEPRRNKDDLQPPPGYEFVLLSTLTMETKPKPILCGSGERYFLCFRRRRKRSERAITDIQITFKSTIPMGYQPLNYLYDGTELPYFQRNEQNESEQKAQSESNSSKNPSNAQKMNDSKPPPIKSGSHGSQSAPNVQPLMQSASSNPKLQALSSGSSLASSNLKGGGGGGAANSNGNALNNGVAGNGNGDQLQDGSYQPLTFDNIPLIIFSKNGESNIIDIQLKELGTKLREGLIHVDRSLDDNVANLNKGWEDANVHPIYLSYANDLVAYSMNLKFLTPLLISLHLRKTDLATTALESLKYLLLSNFIRFRDNDIMILALNKICAAVSHSVVTWNTLYHDKLMEMQIIIFQKFIHHLPAQCLWSMLVSSLIPLKYDLPKKFLKKYIETSFSYIRILEFGDSLQETGSIKKKTRQSVYQNDHRQTDSTSGSKLYGFTPQTPGSPSLSGFKGGYDRVININASMSSNPNPYTPNEMGQILVNGALNASSMKPNLHFGRSRPSEDSDGMDYGDVVYGQCLQLVFGMVDKAVSHHIAEKSLVGFYRTDSFSVKASQYVGRCCRALFVSDSEKPWKPLSCMIIFLCRMALSPQNANVSRLRERSCRYCTRLLEKIIDTATHKDYVMRMPLSFKFLLRRTVSRTIVYNLCNSNQHEIGVILTQVILPQVMERFTPLRRRQKFLSCISRILQHDRTLIELVYSLDIISGTRCIHGIVDALMGILVETAAILKHAKPTFEIADQSAKSYTNNYNFHHLAIQCLHKLIKSYTAWFNQEVLTKQWSSRALSQCVSEATFGFTERRWEKWMKWHRIQIRAKEMAADTTDEKAVRHAIALLLEEAILTQDANAIAQWLLQNRFDIPASSMGEYLGGSRPKNERPFEEDIRLSYIGRCEIAFAAPIEIVMGFFLTRCGFRLPAESQKIQRILESFAEIYHERNPGVAENADPLFVLLNAILMLNTSLHNDNIKDKDKMKKSAFLSICTGIDGCNFSKTDFERIFDYIEKNAYEIKFESEAIKVRAFDEWRKKGIQHARRPLVAFTQEIKKEMKRVATSRHLAVDKALSAQGPLSRSHSARLRSLGHESNASLTRPNTFHGMESKSALNPLMMNMGASPSPSFRNPAQPLMFGGSGSNNSASNSSAVPAPLSPSANSNVNAAVNAAVSVGIGGFGDDDDLVGDTPYGMAINVDNYTTAGFMDDDELEPESTINSNINLRIGSNSRVHRNVALGAMGGVIDRNESDPLSQTQNDHNQGHIPLRHSSDDEDDEDQMAMIDDDDDLEMDEHGNVAIDQADSNTNDDGKDDDEKDLDEEQKEIEAAMRSTFAAHSVASKEIDAVEYQTFCSQLQSTAFWWLGEVATRSTDLVLCENSVELGCLLIDNWWPRILDALKIVFELNDDPYVTPLVLSILPHFLQITLTLGAFGHETCRIALNGILTQYKTWWLGAMKRMDEESKKRNGEMATEADLKRIEAAIWGKPQKYYAQLKAYILSSQHIVHTRTIWSRLRNLQFQFSDVNLMRRGREFIGEQTILKMGARDTTYRLFFFSDLLLYANGRAGKYRSHRVLFLIFCALEDLKDGKGVTNAFRIHSPQKSVTIALPNAEYKRICFKKINELIVKQRKSIRQLIQDLLSMHRQQSQQRRNGQRDDIGNGQNYEELAMKFKRSSAFLHQSLETIKKGRKSVANNCKLCLQQFNVVNRRKKECPICNDFVCSKCITRKAKDPHSKNSKKRNVCDGCLDIVEERLRL